MCAVWLHVMVGENQRLLLLNARLAVICETIAQLRLERSCRPPHTHAQQ